MRSNHAVCVSFCENGVFGRININESDSKRAFAVIQKD